MFPQHHRPSARQRDLPDCCRGLLLFELQGTVIELQYPPAEGDRPRRHDQDVPATGRQRCKIGAEGREPFGVELTRLPIDQQGRTDLDDDPSEIFRLSGHRHWTIFLVGAAGSR